MFIFASGVDSDAFNLEDAALLFSRAGNLYLDDNNHIVNANGDYLVGLNENGEIGRIRIPKNSGSFSIQGNGIVNYIDEENQTQEAGQIRLAKFANPGGLEQVGGNMYRSSVNDGIVGEAGIPDLLAPEEEGVASIVSGALEMSNVDLAEEFTDMIVAQRGFQANTRIITTSDEILQELVNLKR